MTETRERPPHGEPTAALDWADPSDLPIEEVRDVFLTLSKALRAYQLYDPNNPVYKRFLANLGEALDRVWETRDLLQALIEEDRFTWMGEEVYRNETRADSLAFMFYRDGVRGLTFKQGIEEQEIEDLLEVLHRARNLQGEAEDLVTMLWDLDIDHFSYSAVEVGGGGPGMDLAGLGEPADLDASRIIENELAEGSDGPDEPESAGDATETTLSGGVSTEDFNPTLYALDEEERSYLRGELHKEMGRDLRAEVLNALFDRLEEPEHPDRQTEILGILRSLIPNFLSRGAVASAAHVIKEIGDSRARPGILSPEADALAESLTDDLSSPEVVEELIRALEDGSIAPDAEELSDLLRHLRPGALISLLRGAEETRDAGVADVLRRAIQGIAEGNKEVVIRLLAADDASVASGAVRLAGRMKIAEAGNALVRLLDNGPRQVRKIVVEVAAEVPSSVLAGALQRLLRDEDRELRVSAARALGKMKYAPAAREFRAVIEEKGFRDADVTEKVAFFEAYGMLAGDEAVPFLDRLLNGKGLLGRRENAEIRAGAALGLGRIRGPRPAEALDKASRDDDPVVYSAVQSGAAGKGGQRVSSEQTPGKGVRPTHDLQEEGRKLLTVIYGALRALKFYPPENEVVQQALDEVHLAATFILAQEGLAELRVVGDFFFLNELRLRLDLRNFSTFGSFARALREHEIGELVVDRGVKREEWAPFLSLLLQDADEDEPFEGFLERLSGTEVERIEVRAERDASQFDLESEEMEGAKRTYTRSVQMAREVLSDIRIAKAVNVSKVKRAVQTIVDQVLSDEPSIIAMTTLREFDEYTFTHSVNVCIFSVVIGQRIGLGRTQLYELGLGALFHDVGKSRVDEAVLNKAGKLTAEEWAAMKEHTTGGLLQLFRLHGFLDLPYRQMLIAYEHHMKRDLSGYPENHRPREPGLFSRIVSAADAFDAGTSVRSYQYRPFPPDEVLREMRDNPERGFDPVVVKALITATGVYPVGTLVILDTFELAIVTRANPDPARPHQPEVKILSDPKGVPLATPAVASLDETDSATGRPKRTVIKTTDAARYDMRVADYVTT